jgi:hypothetical protein
MVQCPSQREENGNECDITRITYIVVVKEWSILEAKTRHL